MLRWPWRRAVAPLTGAPAVRREKNYSSESGYVYRYYYLGLRPSGGGEEYVFEVGGDRRVSVLLRSEALARWEQVHQRSVTAAERYAVAKLSLQRAFDECPEPGALRREVAVSQEAVESILETLEMG